MERSLRVRSVKWPIECSVKQNLPVTLTHTLTCAHTHTNIYCTGTVEHNPLLEHQ